MNIWTYALKRLLYTIPIIFGVTLVLFFIFNVVLEDPTYLLVGKHATPKILADLRHQLGLDRSLWMQYLDLLKSSFTLDFGHSWATKQNIMSMIYQGAGPSLSFTLPAFVIATVISVLISLLISYLRGTVVDRMMVFILVAMVSVSSLTYILFGQWFFAYYLGWFPISGYDSEFPGMIEYILLPVIIYVILSIGPDVRFYRSVILDEVYQDYVRTARAKGLSEKMVFFKHVLKNAMIPIITYVVIQIPYLVLGAVVVESFFGIPGLGGMTLQAVNSYDFPVLKALTILSAIATVLFNVITDILYTVVDPRVRLK